MSTKRDENRESFPEFSKFYDELSAQFAERQIKVVVKYVEEGDRQVGRWQDELDQEFVDREYLSSGYIRPSPSIKTEQTQ